MTKKELLVYEMESLMKALEKYLKELDAGEIDETAYQLLDADMYTLTVALRIYFGEDPFANQQIIILEPEA